MKKKLSEPMRQMVWAMLANQRKPGSAVVMLNDERTIGAFVRRGILKFESGGYLLNASAARKALAS